MAATTHTYKIIVNRSDNGTATYTFERDHVLVSKSNGVGVWSGGWDDATPWSSGTYNVNFHNYSKGVDERRSFAFGDSDFPGRSAILLHQDFGKHTSINSQGCVVVDPDFIDFVYSSIENDGVKIVNEKPSPVQIEVDNDFDVQLDIKAKKAKIPEGDNAELKISLTGDGAAGGISKDLWVFITAAKSQAGAGALPDDVKRLNTNNVEVRDENGKVLDGAFKTSLTINEGGKGAVNAKNGFWVKIPEGQKSISVLVDTVVEAHTYDFGNNITNNDNDGSSIIFSISNYALFYKSTNGTDRYYKDGTTLNSSNHLMSGASNISTVVDILDQPLIASSRYDQFYTRNSETGQFESNFDPSGRACWTVFLDVEKSHTFSITGDRKASFHLVATVMRKDASVTIGDFVVENKAAGHFKIDKASLADTDGSVTITDFSPPSLNSNSTLWTLAFDGAKQSAPASPLQRNAQPQLAGASFVDGALAYQGLGDLIAPVPQSDPLLAYYPTAIAQFGDSYGVLPATQSGNSNYYGANDFADAQGGYASASFGSDRA